MPRPSPPMHTSGLQVCAGRKGKQQVSSHGAPAPKCASSAMWFLGPKCRSRVPTLADQGTHWGDFCSVGSFQLPASGIPHIARRLARLGCIDRAQTPRWSLRERKRCVRSLQGSRERNGAREAGAGYHSSPSRDCQDFWHMNSRAVIIGFILCVESDARAAPQMMVAAAHAAWRLQQLELRLRFVASIGLKSGSASSTLHPRHPCPCRHAWSCNGIGGDGSFAVLRRCTASAGPDMVFPAADRHCSAMPRCPTVLCSLGECPRQRPVVPCLVIAAVTDRMPPAAFFC